MTSTEIAKLLWFIIGFVAGAVSLACISIPVALRSMRREERAGKLRVVP